MSQKIKELKIDQDIINFLRCIYFGNISDPIEAASSRAYRDMNRTIRFHGLDVKIRYQLRDKVNCILKKDFQFIDESNITSKELFNALHLKICDKIKNIYLTEGVTLTYGQAQKWVNMTIKYLYMLGWSNFDGIFQYLHIPLDNYIFDFAMEHFGIEKPKKVWSKWDDYENEYLKYQYELLNNIKIEDPLRWEFHAWLEEAKNMTEL